MSRDERSGGNDGDGESSTEPTTAQKAVMALSGLFALALLGYAGWQIVTGPPPSPPAATVVDTEPLADGRVAVTVQLRNPNDRGLVRATVESSCTEPPPQVEFTFVPAHDTLQGTLVCPAGTSDPTADVTNWVQR